MLNPRVCSVMELLPLVCLCILTWSGGISADPNGPLITKITVKEDDKVVLPCSFGSLSITDKLFDWKKDGDKEVFMFDKGQHYNNGLPGQDETFRDRVTHFPDKLQSGNASIVIKKTKVADSGNYTCDFPREQPTRRSEIELIVGICPKPVVTIRNETKDGMLLQCEAVGAFPKPDVELQDSAGFTIPPIDIQVSKKGDYYDIILTASVTKKDHYWCAVKQKEICHQIYSEKTLVLMPSGSNTYVVVGVITAVLATVVVGAVIIFLLVKSGCLKLSFNRGSRTAKNFSSEKNKEQNETRPLDIQEKEST